MHRETDPYGFVNKETGAYITAPIFAATFLCIGCVGFVLGLFAGFLF